MSEQTLPPRPAPKPETELDRHWAATADGHIGLGHCQSCDRTFFPAQHACPGCWSAEVTTRPAAGTGTIEAVSVVHRHGAPEFVARLPYAVVMVRLDEGVALTSSVVGVDAATVSIGQRVKAVFEAAADGTAIPLFTREEA